MIKKTDARITEKHYTLENDILTLQLNIGDYDTTDKTITATFSPSGVETGYLDAVDGVVSLPIYTGYIEAGINYVQLNFRWGADKLEQSPMMIWRVESSLASSGVTPDDVDIVTQLIADCQAIEAAEALRVQAESDREAAEGLRQTAYTQAEGARDALYTQAEADREAAYDIAEAARTASIGDPANLNTEDKSNLVGAINEVDGDLAAHKADYATQIDFIINNYLQGHNWQASTNIQNFSSDNEIMTFTGGGSGMVSANNWVRPINYLLLTNTNIIYTTCLAKTISFTSGKLFGFGIGYHSNDTLLNLESYTRASMVMSSVSNAYPTMSADLGHRVEVKQPMSIDLTETFGAGNEPTKEEMDTLIDVLGGWFDGELTPTQKQLANWQLKMIRENRSAIIALGGSI